ncbi:MAG: phenylalanine--tRNA ligase subunit beta, partial [Planctomycetia bacterium]
MIISTTWLSDYVSLPESVDALVERLMLSGLNHESTRTVGADTAVEIEVTSNRPDCLGHVGVAREAAVLFSRPLHLPDPRPPEGGAAATTEIAVEILAPEICPSYTARVIKGVRVGPSPAWLVERLATVGVASINNVVDVTNYVMLECGQPLHAFDLAKVRGGRISVRRAAAGESFTAINHKTYPLTDAMGVIADAEGAVALAGVMGGARTEIDAGTTDVLLESAQFAPLTVRAAARGLVLASGSSYRFERVPDPAAVDWASRRAAALILELAGGQLMRGAAEAGRLAASPATIDLRHARVAEVLGIEIPVARQQAILVGLGFVAEAIDRDHSRWKAPTWRR